MILMFKEELLSDFEGTVIDIETIGELDRSSKQDSRQYRKIQQVIFGYITNDRIHIYCAKGKDGIDQLAERIVKGLDTLNRPFYAFNCDFESGVWFHHLGVQIRFDGELNGSKYESKRDAIHSLGIPNYADPFNDQGLLCIKAWEGRRYKLAVAHNRACLIKEKDILIKRGYRVPNELQFVP